MKKIKSPVTFLVIVSVVLMFLSLVNICIFGQNTELEINVHDVENISIEYDKNIAALTNQSRNGDILELDFKSVKKGKSYVDITGSYISSGESFSKICVLYVHTFGIITVNEFLGRCDGDIAFSISASIVLLTALLILRKRYKTSMKRSICRYANIGLLGLMIFFGFMLLWLLFCIIYDFALYGHQISIMELISNIKGTGSLFSVVLFPVALLISVIISVSNIILLKREGISWRNMLGFFLGFFICIATFIPIFGTFIFSGMGIDVFNERGLGLAFLDIFEFVSSIFIAYLECLLLGTVISGIIAAKHIPKFDKDYILILGCQINKDGTLTKLLQSRTDRAVEFAKMQKDANGRDIVFVPSGGQGSDEIMPEAEAIKNYLVSTGISEDKILVENKSVNTYQNIKFSYNLIKEQNENANIALSTTNYHVFRAGCIADDQNIKIEGIGAKTKSYFWINAFIREFIATLNTEKRNHMRVMVSVMIFSFILEFFIWYCRNI